MVLGICREKARILLAELIAFVLFPVQEKCGLTTINYDCKETNIENRDIPWTLKRRLLITRALANEIPQNLLYISNLLDVNLVNIFFLNVSFLGLSICFKNRITRIGIFAMYCKKLSNWRI